MITKTRPHVHRVDYPDQLKNLVGKLVLVDDTTDEPEYQSALYRGVTEYKDNSMHKFVIRANDPETIVIKLFPEDCLKMFNGYLITGCVIRGRGHKEFIYHPDNPSYEFIDKELRKAGI